MTIEELRVKINKLLPQNNTIDIDFTINQLLLDIVNTLSSTSSIPTTIYTGDGSLSSNRTVTLNGKTLAISGSFVSLAFDDTAKTIVLSATNGLLSNLIKNNGNSNILIDQTQSGKGIAIQTLDDQISITSGASLILQSTGANNIALTSSQDIVLTAPIIDFEPSSGLKMGGASLPSSVADIDSAYFAGGGKLTIVNGFITVIA